MLLQSPPPDLTIRHAFDFGSHLGRSSEEGPSSHVTISGHSQTEPLSQTAVLSQTAILDSVSEMAEVRPIVFDRQHALARLGGLEDLLMDVVRVMRTESQKVHFRMNRSFAVRDATELKRAAHTLMGSASIVGAKDLVARLRRVEELAVTSNFDAIADELPEIDRQFNALRCCLDDELMAHVCHV